MKTTVTLSLHENYVNVVIRAYKQASISYVEHSLFGASCVELLKEPTTLDDFLGKVATFEEETRNVRAPYIQGFKGHFTLTYELTNVNDITEYNVTESRYINESRGGRSVSGAFKDKLLGKKIFMNLLNAAASKDIVKLNGVMAALYTIG